MPRRPGSPLRLMALLCLALCIHAARSWGQASEHIGTVLAVDGTAEVQPQDATSWERLRFRDTIFLSDTVRTGAQSKAKILLRDDTIVTLSEQSEIVFSEFLLTEQQRQNVVSLLFGTLKVITTRIFGTRSAMQVHTPNTVAGVRGTTFIVRFTPPVTTEIFVLDGTVDAHNLDAASPHIEPIPTNTHTTVVGTTAPRPPTAMTPGQMQSLERESHMIEQVPTEVTPTERLEPPSLPRGTAAAPPTPRTQGAALPGTRPMAVGDAPRGPVGIPPVLPFHSGMQPPAPHTMPGNPQVGDHMITPDTSPVARERIEKSRANVIINFPKP